jgi:hypothetical protein
MVKCAVKKTGEGAYDVNCDATTSRSNSASVIGMPGVTPVNPATATAVTASTTANAVAANAAKANAAAAQAAAAQAAAAQAATGAAAANANAAKAKAKAQHQNLIKQIPSASKTLKPISSTSVLQKIPNVTNVPVNAATNAVIKETKDMVKKEADAQRAAQEAAKAAIMNGGRRTKRQPKHTKRKQTKRKQTKRGKNTKRK